MTLVKNKLAVAVAIALSTSFGLVGCDDDKSVSTAVGVPNPNTLMPTGTIQGVLRDSVTNEPIVGAVVDIGIAKATTTETGQFVIKDVPATKSTGASGAGSDSSPYQVTIDLRNVKQATGAAKYPSFAFAEADVAYSSLNDGSNDAGTSSSNHDTPVTGLTAPMRLTVGKLAAGIKGTVIKGTDYKAVGAGYTVKLVSVASEANDEFSSYPNSTTGNSSNDQEKYLNGNVVATTTTDATGAFTFSGIESLHDFRIEVINADGTEYGVEKVRSPADGQVKTLLAQRNPNDDPYDLRTVFVTSTDNLAPKLVKTTPETGTDRAPGANVTVTFSFSEPIASNGLTNSLTASTAGNGGHPPWNQLISACRWTVSALPALCFFPTAASQLSAQDLALCTGFYVPCRTPYQRWRSCGSATQAATRRARGARTFAGAGARLAAAWDHNGESAEHPAPFLSRCPPACDTAPARS